MITMDGGNAVFAGAKNCHESTPATRHIPVARPSDQPAAVQNRSRRFCLRAVLTPQGGTEVLLSQKKSYFRK